MVPSRGDAGRLLAASVLALGVSVCLDSFLLNLPEALLLSVTGGFLLAGYNAYDRGELVFSLSLATIVSFGIVLALAGQAARTPPIRTPFGDLPTIILVGFVYSIVALGIGLLGHRAGLHLRDRDPPMHPTRGGIVRLLVAMVVGACLFAVLYGRVLGGVAFFSTVGSGVLLLGVIAGYNGYDGGIALTAVLVAAVITTGIVAAMALTDVRAILSQGPGHVDMPDTGVGIFVWLGPAILLGLLAHRLGTRIHDRRATTE